MDIPLEFKDPFSVNPEKSSSYIKKCLILGHQLCLQKKVKGIINCAIDKKNLFKNKNMGITEYLAKNKVYKSEVMVIYNKKISVVPLTTHIKVREISKYLKKIC